MVTNLNEVEPNVGEQEVSGQKSALVGCVTVTNTVTDDFVVIGLGEILDSLSIRELQSLIIRIEKTIEYREKWY